MKRIVMLALVMLVVFAGIGKARVWVRYSPYAFSHKYPSGLVPNYVRYSPYAFSHQHPSGLIDGYSGYPYPYYFPPYDCPPPIIVRSQVRRIRKPIEPREKDAKDIIYNHLKSKNLNPDIGDGFRFRNQTVAAVFLIRSKKWLIKYQNPGLEKSLQGNSLWERYKKRCEAREKEYKLQGWRIGNIILNK